MKKREFALALTILTAVSTACIRGMKAVGARLARKDTTIADLKEAEDGTLR